MVLLIYVNYTYQMSFLFQTVALFHVRLNGWSGLEYLFQPLVMANSIKQILDSSPLNPILVKIDGITEEMQPSSKSPQWEEETSGHFWELTGLLPFLYRIYV